MYDDKEKLHRPKQDIEADFFQGAFIKGTIQSAVRLMDAPTQIRVIAPPFVVYTGNAVADISDERDSNGMFTKNITAVVDRAVKIPLCPMNDDNLLKELTIEIVEQRATEHVLATRTIDGEELRTLRGYEWGYFSFRAMAMAMAVDCSILLLSNSISSDALGSHADLLLSCSIKQ